MRGAARSRAGWLSRLMSHAVHVRDDRGREVEVDTMGAQDEWADDEDDELESGELNSAPPAPKHGRVVRVLQAAVGVVLVLAFVGGCIGVFAYIGWQLSRGIASVFHVPAWAGVPALIGLIVVAACVWPVTLGRQARRGHLRRVVPGRLTQSWCGACRYELTADTAEADGCTVCPECGAAWALEKWKREFPKFAPPEPPESGRKPRVRRPTLNDARDRHVPILARRDALVVKADVRSRKLQAWMWIRPGLGDLFAIPVIALLLLLVSGGSHSGLTGAVPLTIAGVSFAAVFLAMRIGRSRKRSAAAMAREFIERGCCPCCEAELPTTPATFDGAIPCRTCGAAWDLKKPIVVK